MTAIRELVLKNRSFRRFRENDAISAETLRGLVDLARLSASAANLQPLRFMLSNTPEMNANIFPALAWAGYIKDWEGPAEGERPAACIIILGDTEVSRNFGCDHGIAAQSILLGAAEQGVGGCMIGSIDRNRLRAALDIPERYSILLVLALGRPAEEVRLEDLPPTGSIEYWRSEDGVHHVPKRALGDIILD